MLGLQYASKIGKLLKADQPEGIPTHTFRLRKAMERFDAVFRPEAPHKLSRTDPIIWSTFEHFLWQANDLTGAALELEFAARKNEHVARSVHAMFTACKNCHEKYRLADE